VPYPKYGLDEPNFMLHQMICYAGEDFGSQQLSVSPLTGQFLYSTCASAFLDPNVVAHSIPQFVSDCPFDVYIKKLKVVEEADVLPIAVVQTRTRDTHTTQPHYL
ncbi:hypothetical protein ARMGADRAFT_921930, partial [Armillaria gallica]